MGKINWDYKIKNVSDDEFQVIVTPYWNVNVKKQCYFVPYNGVIVTPYWNVNKSIEELRRNGLLSNSNTILECK